MPRTSIRVDVRQRLVELLSAKAELANVQVEYGDPPDGANIEAVFLGSVDGEITTAARHAARVQRDDRWSMTVHVLATVDGGTLLEADRRCDQLAAAVEDVVARNPRLDDLHGLVHAVVSGASLGPNAFRTETGATSYRTLTLSFLARLT